MLRASDGTNQVFTRYTETLKVGVGICLPPSYAVLVSLRVVVRNPFLVMVFFQHNRGRTSASAACSFG